MGLFTLAWNSIVEVFKLVALPVTKARGSRRFAQALRWTLHGLAVATILGCLGWLNYLLDVEQILRTPWHAARSLWLPLMFGLVYCLAWLGWWLCRVAMAPREASLHPDIDDAWSEALGALDQAGIDVSSTPLFLVLGRPASPELSLFNAARISLTVPQVPRRRDAPLHVYANDEAIYLTCAGASLLGRQSELFLETTAKEPATPEPGNSVKVDTSSDDALAWGQASFEPPKEWTPESDGLAQLEHGVALLVEEEKPLAERAHPKPVAKTEPRPHSCILDAGDEAALCQARLSYLCQSIAEIRRPYCPINGVLILAPLAGTDSDLDANNLSAVIEKELEVVQEALNVSCPVVSLLCDLEQASGCAEFLQRMPEEQRRRRLGATFPHMATCDSASLPAMIGDGLDWLCRELTPSLVYRMIPSPQPDATADLPANINRYRFLSEVRGRQARIARILSRGINPESTPWQLRGCYLAATGADAVREQAFVSGVFPALTQLQNALAWTPAALEDDRACRLWSRAGYALLAAFATVSGLLLFCRT